MRALPEGMRHLLAAGSLLISSLLLVLIWGVLVSSDLSNISGNRISVQNETNDAAQIDTTLSPSAGIAESLKGIQEFISSQIQVPKEENLGNTWNWALTQMKLTIAGRRAFISEKLKSGLDSTMRFLYGRLSRRSMSSELHLDQE